MLGHFTRIAVADPHETSRLLWENLPATETALLDEQEVRSRLYEALDRRRFRLEPASFRAEFAIAHVGAVRTSRIVTSSATQFTIGVPGLDACCVSVVERGASRLTRPGTGEPAIAGARGGLIFAGEPRTSFATEDGSIRLNLWLPQRLLRQRLEVLLDGQKVEAVSFRPVFDQTRGAGATIRRMLDFLFVELENSDSLLTNEIASRSFEENLALCLLLGLPHNHSEGLLRQNTAAAPVNVKRAEEFMRASAGMPLTIAEIAAAAGCSVRALQMAFHHFRGTTPMAALQRARLDEARTEMLRPGRTASLARIAAEHGFSNPTRFAQLFRRIYGVLPSEVLRGRRESPAEEQDGEPPAPLSA